MNEPTKKSSSSNIGLVETIRQKENCFDQFIVLLSAKITEAYFGCAHCGPNRTGPSLAYRRKRPQTFLNQYIILALMLFASR